MNYEKKTIKQKAARNAEKKSKTILKKPAQLTIYTKPTQKVVTGCTYRPGYISRKEVG